MRKFNKAAAILALFAMLLQCAPAFATVTWSDGTGTNSVVLDGRGANASGQYSLSLGYNTTASGNNSTAMGAGTGASGNGSTAMGMGSNASGFVSTAMGYVTRASGN